MLDSNNVDKNIKLMNIKPKTTGDKMSLIAINDISINNSNNSPGDNQEKRDEIKSMRTEDALDTTINNGLLNKQTVDDPNDKKLLRKLDLHLLPGVTLFYLLNFLDRVNIGQAKLNGLTTSLHLSSTQYNACLSVFFVTYVIFEIPSNLALKKLRPSRWIPLIMVAWGIVMTFMGLVNSYSSLLACRLLLGATESGLFPGKYCLEDE